MSSQTNDGVPPFGHSTQLRVFVDPDLLQYDEVWAAAGTWNDNFGASPGDVGCSGFNVDYVDCGKLSTCDQRNILIFTLWRTKPN